MCSHGSVCAQRTLFESTSSAAVIFVTGGAAVVRSLLHINAHRYVLLHNAHPRRRKQSVRKSMCIDNMCEEIPLRGAFPK